MSLSAELDTQRRAIGLSIFEMAFVCGCKERTVNRWMKDMQNIPAWVSHRLDALETKMQDMADEYVAHVKTSFVKGTIIQLKRFHKVEDPTNSETGLPGGLPNGAHATLISWIAEDLREAGWHVEINWLIH